MTLGTADGVVLLDGRDVPKKGQESVGVQRHYCGELGTIANCQAGVFLGYASAAGATLLDRRMDLPQSWVADPASAERRQTCGLPAHVAFQTKPDLGVAMIRAVRAAQILRCRWLAADEAFGRDTTFLDAVAELGLWYFVDVPHDTRVGPPDDTTDRPTVRTRADAVLTDAWARHTIKNGRNAPITADIVVQWVQTVRDRAPYRFVWSHIF